MNPDPPLAESDPFTLPVAGVPILSPSGTTSPATTSQPPAASSQAAAVSSQAPAASSLAAVVASPAASPTVPAVGTPVVDAPATRPLPETRPITTRVLHVVNGEHFSGAERVQSHLGRCLPAYGVAADFACVKPGRYADAVERRAGEWGRCHRTPMRGRLDLRPAWQIRDLLVRHGYDLIHAHTPRTAMIAAMASRLSGVPWVYHVHSPAGRDSARGWSNRFNASIERLALLNCGHLITVSESLRDDCIRGGFDPSRITVVHNGVPAIRPPRRSEPVPGGRWTLGMVALMRPRKGLEVALEAIAKLRTLGHDVTLRCIGPFESDAYASEISDRIGRLRLTDHVEWVGFTDDIPAELARLDALLLPSLYGEGLPMVVLESMAAGLPVIATRVEGTPEAIRDGVDGLLAEPGDPVSLGERIEDLVTGCFDWGVMAESASRRHAEGFSDHSMARGTAEVYRRVRQPEDQRVQQPEGQPVQQPEGELVRQAEGLC